VKTDNWEISMARALVVVRELEKGGLPLSRLMAAGVGDKDPIAADGSPSELSLNRRVEVIIAPTDDEVSTLHRAL
jgi:chemotaxis protein MotB